MQTDRCTRFLLSSLVSLAGVLSLILLLSVPSYAESELRLESLGLDRVIARGAHRHPAKTEAKVKKITPVILKGRIKGLGPVSIELRKQRLVTWKSYRTLADGSRVLDTNTPILLRGRLHIGRKHTDLYQGHLPVAVSVIEKEGGDQLRVSFIGQGRRKKARFYELRTHVGSKRQMSAKVKRFLESPFADHSCGTAAVHESFVAEPVLEESESAETEDVSVTAVQYAELSTEADPEYFAEFGASANSEIAAIVDAVNTIYQRDLELSLSIHQQNVHESTSPYDGLTSSSLILDTFRSYTNTNQHLGSPDLSHLFSGKDFDSSVAGLAFKGVVCNAPTFSYGISMRITRSLDTVVVAHEIGHNFDAGHDETSASPGIMEPVANPANITFSSLSIGEVSDHTSANSSCLSDSDPGSGGGDDEWLVSMTKQKESKRKRSLVVQLFQENSSAGAGQTVTLYRVKSSGTKLVSTAVTDENGQVVFGPYKRSTRAVKKYRAEFEDGTTYTSGTLKMKKWKK